MDFGGNGGEFREERYAVVEGGFPVFGFRDAFLVRFCKDGGVVESGHGAGELGHWMKVGGEIVEHGGDERGEGRFGGEFAGEGADLGGGRDLTGEEKPEDGFGEHLGAGGTLWEDLLAVGDGVVAEADPFVGVKD